MSFISVNFFIFFAIFFFIYYIIPEEYKWIILLIGNYFFYGWNNIKSVPALILVTVITYLGGIVLENNKKKGVYAIFFILTIGVLAIYKYFNFFIYNINDILNICGIDIVFKEKTIDLPIGLSFFIFQACTYLSDVYRKGIKAEKNIFVYAAFVSFFPNILSGPIQKYRNLYEQIKKPQKFNFDMAKIGLILFVWGLFEKIVISNSLSTIVNGVYNNLEEYDFPYYFIAVISFSLYIYADFSAYTDMARGVAKILGFEITKNFNNPYLSTSLSEFWNCWHISLNEWFIENIYIPLGGNRKGKTRQYINILIVFCLSGLWHGANWHYIMWGLLNGVLDIIGKIIKPIKTKIYQIIHINEQLKIICYIRRIIVFLIISSTWIFFRNGIKNSIHIITCLFTPNLIALTNFDILKIFGTYKKVFIVFVFLSIFCIIQICRKQEIKYYLLFNKQPAILQCALLAIIIYICIFNVFSSASTGRRVC